MKSVQTMTVRMEVEPKRKYIAEEDFERRIGVMNATKKFEIWLMSVSMVEWQ